MTSVRVIVPRRPHLLAVALVAALCAPRLTRAQDSTHTGARTWLAAGALTTSALLLDRPAREEMLEQRGRGLDRLASVADALGRDKYLVPALAGGYLAARLAHSHRWSSAVAGAAVSYVTTNLAESALKGAVGRARPRTADSPWRFRPFRGTGDWQSFPSAHTVHAFTIATALAEGTHDPWVAGVGYGVASLVAGERVYADMHWTSDVVASALLATALTRVTLRVLHSHHRLMTR